MQSGDCSAAAAAAWTTVAYINGMEVPGGDNRPRFRRLVTQTDVTVPFRDVNVLYMSSNVGETTRCIAVWWA